MTPDCRKMRCKWSMHYDEIGMRRVYQHGENGEAVLLIDDYELMTVMRPHGVRTSVFLQTYLEWRVTAWVGRVHNYEQRGASEPAGEGRGE